MNNGPNSVETYFAFLVGQVGVSAATVDDRSFKAGGGVGEWDILVAPLICISAEKHNQHRRQHTILQ